MAYGSILGQTVEIPQPVNTVASGNMNAVTSNAVYQALQNLPAGVQIATGSYVGTETSHTISLTFDFPIKFFFISALNQTSVGGAIRNFSSGYYLTESEVMTVLEKDSSVSYLQVTLSDDQRTISWTGSASYSSLASTFNALTTYYYKAIG